MNKFKVGDTIPLFFRLAVNEDGVDVSATTDFTGWAVSCQWETSAGVPIYTVPNPMLAPGVLDCSLPAAVSSTLLPNTPYVVDIRIRDENGIVRSSPTFSYRLEPAVSELP